MTPRAHASGTVLDWTGTPIARDSRPPTRIADTGGVREPWASRVIRDVTADSLAGLLRLDCELSEQMALCKRIQNDPHIFSVLRTLKLSIAGLAWEVLPADDSPKAEEIRAFVEAAIRGIPRFSQLLVHLLDGEFKPFSGVELHYDPKTWLPVGFQTIDPIRWTWNREANALYLRTIRAPQGELLPPNGFLIHHSELEPGTAREGGLWRKCAWLYLFIRFVLAEWVRFAELYGKPFRIAFYEDRNEKEAILEAIRELGVNAAGVFPAGTEVRLEEAQRYGSVNLYDALKKACEEGVSKVVLGHALNADAKTGTGMQAGNAAKQVSDENKQAVAIGLGDTLRDGLIRPLVGWHFGWQYEALLPRIKFAYEPAEDLKHTAETYKIVNELLAAVGEAIDPELLRQKFGIAKTVKRAAAAPPRELPPHDPKRQGDEDGPEDEAAEKKERKSARIAAADGAPVLRSLEDVQAVSSGLAHRASQELTSDIVSRARRAESVETFIDDLWSSYDELPNVKMAAVIRDASVVSFETGRAAAQ